MAADRCDLCCLVRSYCVRLEKTETKPAGIAVLKIITGILVIPLWALASATLLLEANGNFFDSVGTIILLLLAVFNTLLFCYLSKDDWEEYKRKGPPYFD